MVRLEDIYTSSLHHYTRIVQILIDSTLDECVQLSNCVRAEISKRETNYDTAELDLGDGVYNGRRRFSVMMMVCMVARCDPSDPLLPKEKNMRKFLGLCWRCFIADARLITEAILAR
jgi:hypothetical protein